MCHKTSPYIANRFRIDLGFRRMNFKHYFDIFGEKDEIDHFGRGLCTGFSVLKPVQSPKPKWSISTFSPKNIEIMLETHSSNHQVHPESIYNVWWCFMAHIRFDKFQCFLVFLSFSPTIAHFAKLSVFEKTQKSFLPYNRPKNGFTFAPPPHTRYSWLTWLKHGKYFQNLRSETTRGSS